MGVFQHVSKAMLICLLVCSPSGAHKGFAKTSVMVLDKSLYHKCLHEYMQDFVVQFQIDLTESVKASINDYVHLHLPLRESSSVTFCINT